MNVVGTIRWFDSVRGEGLLRKSDQSCVPIHFTEFYTPSDRNFSYPTKGVQEWLEENLTSGTRIAAVDGRLCVID